MASQAVVQILIKARDEASRVLEGVAGASDKLYLALGAIGAAGMGMAAAMTMTAARTEELGLIVNQMGRVHGVAAESIQRLEDHMKNLGITTQGARLIMTRFMGSQMDLAKAADTARAAQDLATLAGVDSTEAAEDLTYAIASLQPRLLRKYSLYVSLVQVKQKASQALGRYIKDLTEAEIRQFYHNKVLSLAAQYTGLYEEKMKTASGQIRSFRRYIQELANEMGEHLLPALKGLVDFSADVLKFFTALPDAVQASAAQFLAVGSGALVLYASLSKLLPALALAGDAVIANTTAMTALYVSSGSIAGILTGIVAILGLLYISWTGANAKMEEAADKAFELADSYELYVKVAVKARQAELGRLGILEKHVLGLKRLVLGQDAVYRAGLLTESQFRQNKRALEMFNTETHEAWRLQEAQKRGIDGVTRVMERQKAIVESLSVTYKISMVMAYADAEWATKQHHANVLTLERRRAKLQADLMKKGYDESIVAEIEGIDRQIHEAKRGQAEMERIFKRQMVMMAITALQQILKPVEALRASMELLGKTEMVSPAALAAGEQMVDLLAQVDIGKLTGVQFAGQLAGILGYQYGGVVPGPVGQPRLIMAHGGETVTPAGGGVNISIGALYGTDRAAATRFGQQIGRDLLSLGVRTR